MFTTACVALIALCAGAASAAAPSLAECKQHWTMTSDPFGSSRTGDTIIHRLYQFANFVPDNTVVLPADYDRVFGAGAAPNIKKFGIQSVERHGNMVTIKLRHQIKDGNRDGWMSIGEELKGQGNGWYISFQVDQTGDSSSISNVEGVFGHGRILGWTVDSKVTAFTLFALENGYIWSHMTTRFGDSDLCATPDHGVANK